MGDVEAIAGLPIVASAVDVVRRARAAPRRRRRRRSSRARARSSWGRTAPARARCCASCTDCSLPTAAASPGVGSTTRPASQAMVFQRPVLLRRSAVGNIASCAARSPAFAATTRAQRVACAVRASASRPSPAARRACSPAASSSAWRSRARGRWRRRCCFSTSPPPASTPASTRAVEAARRGIHALGTTIVMTTHHLAQAKRLADIVLFLHRGPRRRARRRPRYSFVNRARPKARAFLRRRALVKASMLPPFAMVARARCLRWARFAQDQFIVVASTTSTQQSGLFGHSAADLREGHRNPGPRRRRRNRAGARHRPPRRRRRRVRARSAGEGKCWPRATASSAIRSCTTISC